MIKNDEKCLFAISEDKETVILGLPTAGWEYMKDGMCHTFDLNKLGVPIKIMLFGGKDRQACLNLLKTGPHTLDMTGMDFGFGPQGKDQE